MAGEDYNLYGGEEAFRQPGGPAAHGSLHTGNQSFRLSVRQEEAEEDIHVTLEPS